MADSKLPSLQLLVRTLQQLPCIAPRHVYKVAHHLLSLPPAQLDQFCKTVWSTCSRIDQCPVCCAWKEKDRDCVFCGDAGRDQGIVCVVEVWLDVCAIERTGSYPGVYHVLGGVLCPIEGIGPEDLTLKKLEARLDGSQKELILALSQTPEGEATAAFIGHMLKGKKVKISCLARGLPVGAMLEFMDKLTLHKALSERRDF